MPCCCSNKPCPAEVPSCHALPAAACSPACSVAVVPPTRALLCCSSSKLQRHHKHSPAAHEATTTECTAAHAVPLPLQLKRTAALRCARTMSREAVNIRLLPAQGHCLTPSLQSKMCQRPAAASKTRRCSAIPSWCPTTWWTRRGSPMCLWMWPAKRRCSAPRRSVP